MPVLDLGCGTGILSVVLGERGHRTIGVDRSARMLAIARRRCRRYRGRVTFKRADLTNFVVRPPASAAIACADVVNHLPSLSAVTTMFRQTWQCLKSGGVFVFDALRRTCFEQSWADSTYYMEGDGGDLVMECDWDPARRVGCVQIVAYEKRPGGGYRKSQTLLREYYYSDQQIQKGLRAAGFKKARRTLWDPWAGDTTDSDVLDRTFWVAYRP